MTLHWTEKRAASANVAHALQADGWQLVGYHADQSDSQSDYYAPASWMDGIATHPAYPGVIVGFDVSATRAEARSGTDEVHTAYPRSDDCPTCGGSGHDLAAPPTTVRVCDDQGWHVESKPAPCRPCHGRGYLVARVDTVLFTWPTFHGTPRGKAWHVEYMGQIIGSGTGFQRAASHHDGPAAAQQIAADITGIARRCVGQSATASTDAAESAVPTPTTASRNGLTITCTYTVKHGSVWTWPVITPWIARDRYDVIKARFDIRSSKTRHTRYITQQIDAAAILAVLEPALAPADAPNAAPTRACATCGDTGVTQVPAPAPTLFVAGNTRVVDTTTPCPDCTDAAVTETTPPHEPDSRPDLAPEPAALPETPSAPPALTPPALAPGQRWTIDQAFQQCDDGTIGALRGLDVARPLIHLPLDTPTIQIVGATVTDNRCTCTEKRAGLGLVCRHVYAVRLIRYYQQHAPTVAQPAEVARHTFP